MICPRNTQLQAILNQMHLLPCLQGGGGGHKILFLYLPLLRAALSDQTLFYKSGLLPLLCSPSPCLISSSHYLLELLGFPFHDNRFDEKSAPITSAPPSNVLGLQSPLPCVSRYTKLNVSALDGGDSPSEVPICMVGFLCTPQPKDPSTLLYISTSKTGRQPLHSISIMNFMFSWHTFKKLTNFCNSDVPCSKQERYHLHTYSERGAMLTTQKPP